MPQPPRTPLIVVLLLLALGLTSLEAYQVHAEAVSQTRDATLNQILRPRACSASLVAIDNVVTWHERFTDETGHSFVMVAPQKATLKTVLTDCQKWLEAKSGKRTVRHKQ